jgi:4-amino-4-deoxy-L-arabinose transferase-like glycosyltransferase
LPLLPALLLPWAPLLLATAPRQAWHDPRRRFLLMWVVFGMVFLSASANKVPGYLLPLLPPLAILMALGAEEPAATQEGGPARRPTGILVSSCALLLLAYPVAAPVLPAAVANIWAAAPRPEFHWTWLLPAIPAVAAWFLDRRGRRLAAVTVVGVCVAAAVVCLKVASQPEVERLASARALSREVIRHPGQVCLQDVRRAWEYGLNYYTGSALPPCGSEPRPFRVVQRRGQPPELEGAGGTTNVPDPVRQQ